MTAYKTEQEKFWAEKFGDEYIERNQGDLLLPRNIALFSKILSRTQKINSLIEFGANIGLNLRAIRQLLPHIELSAVEINANAVAELKSTVGGV
jgi:spore coat polysaccharide biosynthesis protein SpsF